MGKPSSGWLGKLGGLIVPNSEAPVSPSALVTNRRMLDELIASFEDSIPRESVGTSMLFNAHFLIILHPQTYEERQNAFPVVVNEAVDAFTAIIEEKKADFERISPVASSWFFKFGTGREFGGEPIQPADVIVVGALTGILPGNESARADNVHVTRRVKQTNRYEKVDVDPFAFRNLDFREPGAFVVKFGFSPPVATAKATPDQPAAPAPELPRSLAEGLARIDYYLADRDLEESYPMLDKEIVIARKEPENEPFSNYLLIESGYVSNPHARIRYKEGSRSFEIASFSRNETRVNEELIPRSEPASPIWFPLPDKAQVLLNSMVTLHFAANS